MLESLSVQFAAIVAEPRFAAAIAAAALSGVVRGFSGFGSAMIYVPLMAAIYEPRIAAVTLLMIDFAAGAPFAVTQARRCNWREVAPVSLASLTTIPLGAMALQYLDPLLLRWGIAALVALLLVVLATGWRYHGTPSPAASVAVGLTAGISAGAVQIAGPVPIVYWLGGPSSPSVIRANLMVYLTLSSLGAFAVYFLRGLLSADALAMSLLLGPVFIVAMIAGAWMFRGASETVYRRIAYAIIALSALVSLPLFDELIR